MTNTTVKVIEVRSRMVRSWGGAVRDLSERERERVRELGIKFKASGNTLFLCHYDGHNFSLFKIVLLVHATALSSFSESW